VNTTRVNAAEITSRVAALKTDKERVGNGKAGFFEEFEVRFTHSLSLSLSLSDVFLVVC